MAIEDRTVIEGVLITIELVSVGFFLFLFYAISLTPRTGSGSKAFSIVPRTLRVFSLFMLISAGLVISHQLLVSDIYGIRNFTTLVIKPDWRLSIAALSLTLVLTTLSYYYFVRKDWDDNDRVQYGLLLWSSVWIIFIFILVLLAWAEHRGVLKSLEVGVISQYVNAVSQTIGILLAATMVVITNRHNYRSSLSTTRQQIYQTLELQSIELFRFEQLNPSLVDTLWYGRLPKLDQSSAISDDARIYLLRQYVCQILNLFEMAVRFKKDNVFESDVLVSWVIWIWELCECNFFQKLWSEKNGLELNYVGVLRDIIDAGTTLANRSESGLVEGDLTIVRRRAFFTYVGRQLGAEKEIEDWLDFKKPSSSRLDGDWRAALDALRSKKPETDGELSI